MNANVKQFFVHAVWDDEAKVWFVSDTDVPGLATEADSLDQLAAKLKVMIPEMLELNGVMQGEHTRVPFDLLTKFDGADGALTGSGGAQPGSAPPLYGYSRETKVLNAVL